MSSHSIQIESTPHVPVDNRSIIEIKFSWDFCIYNFENVNTAIISYFLIFAYIRVVLVTLHFVQVGKFQSLFYTLKIRHILVILFVMNFMSALALF